jgi:superfamily II helicase
LGSILVSTKRYAKVICYKGDVCNFLNQLQTNTNAKNRIANGFNALANYAKGSRNILASLNPL